jgi:hypothetical protein
MSKTPTPEYMNAYNTKILDLARYNGRVNMMEQPDAKTQFALMERVALKNKATEYRGALSNDWEASPLSRGFFSAANVQIIQNGLRAGVYEKSNKQFIILPQNVDTIKTIMRSIYMQYAEHRLEDVPGQIAVLNKLVLNYAVPYTYNEAVGQIKYLNDVSTLAVPFDRPTQVDREYLETESNREFWVNQPKVGQSDAQWAPGSRK